MLREGGKGHRRHSGNVTTAGCFYARQMPV